MVQGKDSSHTECRPLEWMADTSRLISLFLSIIPKEKRLFRSGLFSFGNYPLSGWSSVWLLSVIPGNLVPSQDSSPGSLGPLVFLAKAHG